MVNWHPLNHLAPFGRSRNKSKTKELKTWDFAQVFSIQASSDVGLVGFCRKSSLDGNYTSFPVPHHWPHHFSERKHRFSGDTLVFRRINTIKNKWWMFHGYVCLRECIWSWMAEKNRGPNIWACIGSTPLVWSTSEGWKDLQNNRKRPDCCYRRIWQHRIDLDCLNSHQTSIPNVYESKIYPRLPNTKREEVFWTPKTYLYIKHQTSRGLCKTRDTDKYPLKHNNKHDLEGGSPH